jgi:hypothetical protein
MLFSLPSQSGLRGGSAGVVVEALSSRYLDWSNQIGGIQRARVVYKRSVDSCKLPQLTHVQVHACLTVITIKLRAFCTDGYQGRVYPAYCHVSNFERHALSLAFAVHVYITIIDLLAINIISARQIYTGK